jgi:hypothetical protein
MLGIVACLAIVIAAAILFRWLLIRSAGHVVSEDRCAKCGYIVIGLPGLICPECGSNLAIGGAIIRRGTRTPMRRGLRVFIWSASFWVSYWAISAAWLNERPEVWIVETDYQFRNPKSGTYDNVIFDYKGEMFLREPISGRAKLVLTDLKGRQGAMEVDSKSGSYRTVSGTSIINGDRGFGKEVVLRWMDSFGIDVQSPEVRLEADSIAQTLHDAMSGGWRKSYGGFQQSGGGSGSNRRELYVVTAGRWGMVLIWAVGYVWLWRRSQ